MAVDFTGSNTGRIDYADNLIGISSFDPITLSMWVYQVTSVSWRNFLSLADEVGSGGILREVEMFTSGVGHRLQFSQYFNTASHGWSWDNAFSTGAWLHILVTYDRASPANDPICYVNGVSQGAADWSLEGGSGGIRTGADSIRIGNYAPSATPSAAWTGYMAEVAVWSKVLSAGDIAVLAAGVKSPLEIDLENLRFYDPMYEDSANFNRVVEGATGSAGGNTAVIAHPPVQQAIIPIRYPTSPSPHALPARINMRDDTSLVPSRDYWGPHVYRRGNRT